MPTGWRGWTKTAPAAPAFSAFAIAVRATVAWSSGLKSWRGILWAAGGRPDAPASLRASPGTQGRRSDTASDMPRIRNGTQGGHGAIGFRPDSRIRWHRASEALEFPSCEHQLSVTPTCTGAPGLRRALNDNLGGYFGIQLPRV